MRISWSSARGTKQDPSSRSKRRLPASRPWGPPWDISPTGHPRLRLPRRSATSMRSRARSVIWPQMRTSGCAWRRPHRHAPSRKMPTSLRRGPSAFMRTLSTCAGQGDAALARHQTRIRSLGNLGDGSGDHPGTAFQMDPIDNSASAFELGDKIVQRRHKGRPILRGQETGDAIELQAQEIDRQEGFIGFENAGMSGRLGIAVNQQFLVELFAGAKADLPDLDIARGVARLPYRKAGQLDHVAGELEDADGLPHVEHEHLPSARHGARLDDELGGFRN